jgi:hypothetical protein
MFRYWVRLMALGGHHPWRQHDQFNGLSEPASPSLRELGARMCSIVGRWTKHYRQCMHQPQAVIDCQLDNYATNWRRECTRLYGSRSRAYRACMRRPQALADCGR